MAAEIVVVLNPVAPKSRTGEVQSALDRTKVVAQMVETSPGENGREQLQRRVDEALEDGCRRVIAAGGDGTVSLAAACLLSSPVPGPRAPLGIVPAGTTNVLARELGIPLGLEEAAHLAAFGTDTVELDVMWAEERLVLTQLGVGPDAQMIRDTSRQQQVELGRLAYLLSLLRPVRRQPARSYEIQVDDRFHRVRAWQIVVANVGTVGAPPLTWGPGIDPTDGALDVVAFDVRQARDYWTVLWRVLTGRHRRDSNTRFFRARRHVAIRSSSPAPVQGDGEPIGSTPVDVRLSRGALLALVPRSIDHVEGIVGSPDDPPSAGGPTIAEVAPAPGEPATTISEDVQAMVAEHSRTWVLQGPLRHPMTALAALDAALFLHANELVLGPVLDRSLLWISRIMHFGEGWAVVAALLMLADFSTGWRAAVTALPCLWLTTLTVNYVLKSIFRRRRPFLAFVKARVLGPRPADTSLPSGHTAAAFAGALLFSAYSPAWSPLYYVIATVVGFSRVYLGVHYPSDVVLGAIAGTVLAALCRALLHTVAPGLR
jgi:diacylglycerol kinase family enzyme/membrane-associated phospholipid phosphatase